MTLTAIAAVAATGTHGDERPSLKVVPRPRKRHHQGVKLSGEARRMLEMLRWWENLERTHTGMAMLTTPEAYLELLILERFERDSEIWARHLSAA